MLRATAACHFSPVCQNSYLRTRRFSEATFRTSATTNHWKNAAIRDFTNIFRACWTPCYWLCTPVDLLAPDSTHMLIFLLLTWLLCDSSLQLYILSEVRLLNFLRLYTQLHIYFIVVILLCAIVLKKMCYLPSFLFYHTPLATHIYIYIWHCNCQNVSHTRFFRPGRIAAVLCYLMFIGDFFLGIAQFESSELDTSGRSLPSRVFSIFTRGCLLNSGACGAKFNLWNIVSDY